MGVLLGYLIVVNVFAFILFCVDKWKAVRHAWRVPERALLGCCAIGGALGGLVGMRIAHHKTRKPLFAVGVPLMAVAWAVVLGWLMAG